MMRNIWLFLVLVGFIISPLMGQDVKKEGEPQKAEFPKNGVVTADKVNLRCGAGENFRALTTLKKNDKLVVVKVEGEWCAVVPPSGLGIFFLIHKRYVNKGAPVGDGFEGEVLGDKVNVRSGDDEKGDTVMGTLNKGDKVVIVGEKEQWFKIKPPEGMYLWVAAKFVKLEQTGEREPENSKPQPTVTEPTEREKALEKELAEIRKQYEELDARLRKKESELNEIRREREERERRVADLERKLKEAEESREETEKRLREAKEIAERMAAESGKRELKYTAVGTVSDFGPYVEGPEGTKYKLLETGDGPVKYYLKPSRSEIRLDDYLSKQVGIIGTVKKVTGWDVPILIVERIEILSK